MGQIKNIKLHIVTDIKEHSRASKMAFLARPLKSLVSGVAARVTSQTCCISSNTNLRTVNYLLSKQMKASSVTFQSYRSLHTDSDRELTSFLQEEIEAEKEQIVQIPKIGKYKMSKKGTLVTLRQKMDDEIVEISFDINKNLNVPIEMEEGAEDEGLPPIVSYPEFAVVITKSSGQTLRLNCNSAPVDHQEEEEEMPELLRIESAQSYHIDTDVSTVYEAEAESMDATMYDILLSVLRDRGVDDDFTQDLVDFSSAVEGQYYLEHLERLSKFARE